MTGERARFENVRVERPLCRSRLYVGPLSFMCKEARDHPGRHIASGATEYAIELDADGGRRFTASYVIEWTRAEPL